MKKFVLFMGVKLSQVAILLGTLHVNPNIGNLVVFTNLYLVWCIFISLVHLGLIEQENENYMAGMATHKPGTWLTFPLGIAMILIYAFYGWWASMALQMVATTMALFLYTFHKKQYKETHSSSNTNPA